MLGVETEVSPWGDGERARLQGQLTRTHAIWSVCASTDPRCAFGLAGLLDFAGDRVGADVLLRQVVKSKSLKGGRRLLAEARKLLTARSHDDEHTHHLLWPGDPVVEVSGERIELAHFLSVVFPPPLMGCKRSVRCASLLSDPLTTRLS